MKKDKLAFPAIEIKQIGDSAYNPPTKVYHHGMSLRDYFAGQALTGLCSLQDGTGLWQYDAKGAAESAYEVADAMLAERDKE